MDFSLFRTTPYFTDKFEILFLTDILQTYRIENIQLSEDLIPYSLKDGDTPESLSYKISETASNSWIILSINKISDLYYGWPMDSNTFEHYIQKKYDDKVALFLDTRAILGTFKPDQNIKIYDENSILIGSATIVEWDRTFSKLVVKNTTGNFEEIAARLQASSQKYLVEVDENNQAKLGRAVLMNSQAVHHFEGENGLYLDPYIGLLDSYILEYNNDKVVTNYQYENILNDEKRKILLPSRRLMQKIKQDLRNIASEE